MSDFESGVRFRQDIQTPSDPSSKGKSWAVIAVIIIILVAFTVFMFVLLYRERNGPIVNQRCNPGLCAFSAVTGIKRCPEGNDTEGLIINPGLEFCTTKDYCQSTRYPCAVQEDQSLNCSGICGPNNSACRCVSNTGVQI